MRCRRRVSGSLSSIKTAMPGRTTPGHPSACAISNPSDPAHNSSSSSVCPIGITDDNVSGGLTLGATTRERPLADSDPIRPVFDLMIGR
jgi:hypothetical protein